LTKRASGASCASTMIYRYPAVDPASFRAAVAAIVADQG
jgi:hypothetical protein